MLLLPWLVTIVDDKSRLVHIHVAWGCWIVQICGTIGSVTVLTIGFALRDCQMACEGLLNLLLVLLTQEGLDLGLAHWWCLRSGTLRVFNRLLSSSTWRLTLLLHFLVLIEQFLLQIIILLLLLRSTLSSLRWGVWIGVSYNVVGHTLQLRLTHLLLLYMLYLLLDSHLVLLVLLNLSVGVLRWLSTRQLLNNSVFGGKLLFLNLRGRRKILLTLRVVEVHLRLCLNPKPFSLSLVHKFLRRMGSLPWVDAATLVAPLLGKDLGLLVLRSWCDAARSFVVVHVKVLLIECLHSVLAQVWLHHLLNPCVAGIRSLLRSFHAHFALLNL